MSTTGSSWRPRLGVGAVDALVGLGVLLLWALAIVVLHEAGWRPFRSSIYWWSGGLLALAIALRRARPVLGFWLVAVATVVVFRTGLLTILQLGPLALATFSVIRSGRMTWLTAGLPAVLAAASHQYIGTMTGEVGTWVWRMVEADGSPTGWYWHLLNVWPGLDGTLVLLSDPSRLVQAEAIVLVAVALGHVVRRLDQTRAELEDRNAALVALQRAESERAVTAERNRIARDLHDVVAHHVTAIVVRSQAAVHVDEPGLARETLGWIAGEGKEALAATRSLVQVLREDSGAMSTTTASLDAVLERTADRVTSSELAVRLELPPELDPLGQELETAIALIAQEALTNVALHSRADEAVVALTVERADRARLVVSDAGPAAGSGVRRAGGNGLRHMTERAEALGGSLTAGPAGAGWRVVADLPVTTRRAP